MNELIQVINKKVFNQYIDCTMLIPYDQGKIVAYLNENAHVKSVSYEADGTLLIVECREQDYKKLKDFVYH